MAPPQKGSCDKCAGGKTEAQFFYQPMFEHANSVDVLYKKHEEMSAGIKRIEASIPGQQCSLIFVELWVLTKLAEHCVLEMEHLLRPGHLQQPANILADVEVSEDDDRSAASNSLQNAAVAAEGAVPSCQDMGSVIVMGKRGQNVFSVGDDEEKLSAGIYEAYTKRNLGYSQLSPVSMFEEKNTKTNLPAQIDIFAAKGSSYEFVFMAKGGGSANQTYLYQQTKALLNPKKLESFIAEKLQALGASACPPYRVALVIGGTSAELCLKTVELAGTGYYDDLPTTGNDHGRAFRDLNWEAKVLDVCRGLKIGADDARVIRLPDHGAPCMAGLGVTGSTDRQILAKITPDGVFVEELEHSPTCFLPSAPQAR